MDFPDTNQQEEDDFLSFLPFAFPPENASSQHITNDNHVTEHQLDEVDEFFRTTNVVVGGPTTHLTEDEENEQLLTPPTKAPLQHFQDPRLLKLHHHVDQLVASAHAAPLLITTNAHPGSSNPQHHFGVTPISSSLQHLSRDPLFASFLQNPHILQFVQNEKIDLSDPDSVNLLLNQIISRISDPGTPLNHEHMLPDEFGMIVHNSHSTSTSATTTSAPSSTASKMPAPQFSSLHHVQLIPNPVQMSPFYSEYLHSLSQTPSSTTTLVTPSSTTSLSSHCIADLTPPQLHRQSPLTKLSRANRLHVREPTIRPGQSSSRGTGKLSATAEDEDDDEMEIDDEGTTNTEHPILEDEEDSTTTIPAQPLFSAPSATVPLPVVAISRAAAVSTTTTAAPSKKKAPTKKQKASAKTSKPKSTKSSPKATPAQARTPQRKSKPVFTSTISEDYIESNKAKFTAAKFDVKLKPARRLNTEYSTEFPKEMCSKPYKYLLAVRSKTPTDFTFFLTIQTERNVNKYTQLSPVEHSSSTGVQVQRVRQNSAKNGDMLQIFYVKFLETSFKNSKKMFKLNIVDKDLTRFQSTPIKLVARRSKSDGQDKFWSERERKTGLTKSKAKPKSEGGGRGRRKKKEEVEDDMDENPWAEDDEEKAVEADEEEEEPAEEDEMILEDDEEEPEEPPKKTAGRKRKRVEEPAEPAQSSTRGPKRRKSS